MKPIFEQLICARWELARRRRVYLDLVRQGKLTPEKSRNEIACMESIAVSLEKLLDLEAVSKELRGPLPAAPVPDPKLQIEEIPPCPSSPITSSVLPSPVKTLDRQAHMEL